jgi:hypothetical protein
MHSGEVRESSRKSKAITGSVLTSMVFGYPSLYRKCSTEMNKMEIPFGMMLFKRNSRTSKLHLNFWMMINLRL